MPVLHPCTAQKLSACEPVPELTHSLVPSSPVRRPPTPSASPRHNGLLDESRWRNSGSRPPADWRPSPSSRFRNAHVALDCKYDDTWRGNDERWVTGRDAEIQPGPYPLRRRDMPPEALRHSAPNGQQHASVVSTTGPSRRTDEKSPDPELSPPVKPCGHRDPCNCAVLRARLGIPEPPVPVAPPSLSPASSTENGPSSASASSSEHVDPVKRTLLVAAKLEVARARDNLAQQRRRWSRVSNAPLSATAPNNLVGSSPNAPANGPAVAPAAPSVTGSASALPSSPSGFPLHHTTRMTPGEMHVRAAEASLANAMLRLVSLAPATDRTASDLDNATTALVDDVEARSANDGLSAIPLADSRLPTPRRTWVRPPDWMPHKANWPGYSEPQPWPAFSTLRNSLPADAPACSVDPTTGEPSTAAGSDYARGAPALSADAAQLSHAASPSPESRVSDASRLQSNDADLLRQYVNAERRQTSPIVLAPISPGDADTELARMLSSVLGVPCSISRREGTLSPGHSATSSTQGSSTSPSSLMGNRSRPFPIQRTPSGTSKSRVSQGMRSSPPTQAWPPTARRRQRSHRVSPPPATRPTHQVSHCRIRCPPPFQTRERVRQRRATHARAPLRPGMSSNSSQSPLSAFPVRQAARNLRSRFSEGSRRRPRVPNYPMRLKFAPLATARPPPPS